MELRIATPADEDLVIDAIKAFHKESPYKSTKFSESHVRGVFRGLATGFKEDGCIIIAYNTENPCTGLLVALKSIVPFSGESVGLEAVWWIYPEFRKSRAGLLLFGAYEYWCKNVSKTDKMQIANLPSLNADTMHKFYTKKGFTKTEESWIRDT